MPYYIHPGSYAAFPPPYPVYPPQGALPPAPTPQPQPHPAQTSDSADAAKKAAPSVNPSEVNGAAGTADAGKKPRTSKSGEPKVKKAKTVNPREVNGTKNGKVTTGNEGTKTT